MAVYRGDIKSFQLSSSRALSASSLSRIVSGQSKILFDRFVAEKISWIGRGIDETGEIGLLEKDKLDISNYSFDAKKIYGDGGKLKTHLKGFMYRSHQEKMASAVSSALKQGHHLMVEAGTGTGKSLAYLIPAIEFAREVEAPVVISTNTINLQDQLYRSDLPRAAQVVDGEIGYTIFKGRNNYLCPERLKIACGQQQLLFSDDRANQQLQYLENWARTTKLGTRSELDRKISPEVWEKVNAQRGLCNCLKSKKRCFYADARQMLYDSEIILVNHHLLLSDLVLRNNSEVGVLPEYGAVICDEAHHLERVAKNSLGLKLSYLQFIYLCNDLWNKKKTGGLLKYWGAEDLAETVIRLKSQASEFFAEIRKFVRGRSTDGYSLRVRELEIVKNSLSPGLKRLSNELKKLLDRAEFDEYQQQELKMIIERIRELDEGLEMFLSQGFEDQVYWIEPSSYRDNVELSSSPVAVDKELYQILFEPLYSAILTSATLTTPGEMPFAYEMQRLGLRGAQTLQLGHPFNYKEQVKLRLVLGITPPNVNKRQYLTELISWLRQYFEKHYVEKQPGRTIVLFTNYKDLNRVVETLRGQLKEQKVEVLIQGGRFSRDQMLERFKRRQPAILFGTASFWEGIDVRGESLKRVIITRLPFPNPKDPLVEATAEQYKKQGKNPFSSYFLPEAVLNLKQGFGRLIRTRSDQGEVTILDSRILRKGYGQKFLKALPECEIVHDDF